MKYEILYNKVMRLPIKEAIKLIEEFEKNDEFQSFADRQKIVDSITLKMDFRTRLKEEVFREVFICLNVMSKRKSIYTDRAFDEIKSYPMAIFQEVIGELEENIIIGILDNYAEELPSVLLEQLILGLNEKKQIEVIRKYYKKLDSKSQFYYSFYYSLNENVRDLLDELFPNVINNKILLELKDVLEKDLENFIKENLEKIKQLPCDEVVKIILLKITDVDILNKVLNLIKDIIDNTSLEIFKLLLTRIKYLARYSKSKYSSSDFFLKFKDKFAKLGIEETLKLFDEKSYFRYDSTISSDKYSKSNVNEFTKKVILELIDIASANIDISAYLSLDTYPSIISKFVKKCLDNDYNIVDFESLINKIDLSNPKLIHDDVIESIIACRKLMEQKLIDDKNPLFIKLRDKFIGDLYSRVQKDGTYDDTISLNALFYRLVKGTINFEDLYTINTYKGIIYLVRFGYSKYADDITKFLTDEQLAKMNVKPVFKIIKLLKAKGKDTLSFTLRKIILELVCYFGEAKAIHILNANLQENTMENLFDNLDYDGISVNDDGGFNRNQELINFLFGNGSLLEPNSVMNSMLRGDIPDFKKYFVNFCNSYYKIKEECHDVLSVARIVRYFNEKDLPIKIMPDEVIFENALREINTEKENYLREAIDLCKKASDRTYSTIPKIKGQLGNFKYEILDLKDSLAVCIGNLTHCCFVIHGASYSSLIHAMTSVNGRVFVVYYNDKLLAQSWVWRNGDIICFDSVEAGSSIHNFYKDDIKLVDVYKKAAKEMLLESAREEDEIQKVKAVTVGRSDYKFDGLESIKIRPIPLENDLYLADSMKQYLLAGSVNNNIRFGEVGARYKDKRKDIIDVDNIEYLDLNILDEIYLRVNALRYKLYNILDAIDVTNYKRIIAAEDWYIILYKDGKYEYGIASTDERALSEYRKYLNDFDLKEENGFTRKLVKENE